MDISLMKDEVVSFKGSLRGITVRCSEGMVWITVAGDDEDYVLMSGDELTVLKKGRVVIVAEANSSVRFYKPVMVKKMSNRKSNSESRVQRRSKVAI